MRNSISIVEKDVSLKENLWLTRLLVKYAEPTDRSHCLGNFHFAPGKSFKHQQMHVHDVQSFAGRIHEFDFTHTINGLSFGNTIEGAHNPLDNYRKDAVSRSFFFIFSSYGNLDSIFYQYFIKIVPSAVSYLNGTTLLTNQYSVTHYEKGQTDGPPSVMPGMSA